MSDTIYCTSRRKNLGITCTKEERQSIELIQNRVSCARQAARADAIPDGAPEESARIFIQAAIESLAQYMWLEQQWWREVKEKYKLPDDREVWVDFVTGEFYILN